MTSDLRRRRAEARWILAIALVFGVLAVVLAVAGWNAGVRLLPVELAVLAVVFLLLGRRDLRPRHVSPPRPQRSVQGPLVLQGPAARHPVRPVRDRGSRPSAP